MNIFGKNRITKMEDIVENKVENKIEVKAVDIIEDRKIVNINKSMQFENRKIENTKIESTKIENTKIENTKIENMKKEYRVKPTFHEQDNYLSDKRVKMIYDRFRSGKSIILDDLKYLWLKHSESCDNLARSIVEANTGRVEEIEPNNKVNISYGIIIESSNEKQVCIDYKLMEDNLIDSSKKVPEVMFSVKLMIENMSENERNDLLNNLYDPLVLMNIIQKMNQWDESHVNKLDIFTYELEKEFNILA